MESNEYLYHYTNIETLALILSNKTIRFNSLNNTDDLQEQETADIKNIGQFFYISSWTDDSTESIPMWNMYASLNLGVRIRLRKNPFKIYDNSVESIKETINIPIKYSSNNALVKTLIPFSEMFNKGFYTTQALTKDILFKVEYTDDKEKLYPHILEQQETSVSLAFGELGRYKNLHWKFQNEWRYMLTILPFNLTQLNTTNMLNNLSLIASKLILGTEKQPFPHYDMKLSEESFSEMQITLSPRISAGNRIIVKSLIEKYNPSAELKESSLIGLI